MLPSSFRAKWKSKKTAFAIAVLVMLAGNVKARAGTILDFSIPSGGSIGIGSGEHHPRLWGRGIKVSDLMYGSHVLPIFSGRLTFSGGSFEGSKGAGLAWGPGGTLSISGCADLNHDAKCDAGDFKGKLLTGGLLNTEIVDENGKMVLEAQLVDQLSPELAALLHLPKSTYRGELDLTLGTLNQGRWWRRDGVRGGFLNDFGNVPEPSSFTLLGAGLLSLFALLWGASVRSRG